MRTFTTLDIVHSAEATHKYQEIAAATKLPFDGIAMIELTKLAFAAGKLDRGDFRSARDNLLQIADRLESGDLSADERFAIPIMLRQLADYATTEFVPVEPISDAVMHDGAH